MRISQLVGFCIAVIAGCVAFWLVSRPQLDESALAWREPTLPTGQELLVKELSHFRERPGGEQIAIGKIGVKEIYANLHHSGWDECRRRFASGYLVWRNHTSDDPPLWFSDLPSTMNEAYGDGWSDCQRQLESLIAVHGEQKTRSLIFKNRHLLAFSIAIATIASVSVLYFGINWLKLR